MNSIMTFFSLKLKLGTRQLDLKIIISEMSVSVDSAEAISLKNQVDEQGLKVRDLKTSGSFTLVLLAMNPGS